MEFEQRGYETFKEFPGGRKGVRQNILSTIEFGFSPFVPFSEDYAVYHGKLGQHGFGVHAESNPADATEDWKDRIAGYGGEPKRGKKTGAKKVIADVNRIKSGELKTKAEELSRQIMLMLESEGIAQKFDSTVKEEVEGQAIAIMGQKWPWKDPRVTEQIDLIEKDQMLAGTGGWSKETFDLYAKTETTRQALEANLHMIARRIGPEGAAFVKGVKAIETTAMTTKKYFQVKMRADVNHKIDQAKAWEEGVKAAIKDLMAPGGTWDLTVTPFKKVYEQIGKQKKKKGEPESLEYFARQTLARFAEMEHQIASGGGQFGEAYIFHAPISRYLAGYARLQPVIKNGMLEDILVKTGTIGGDAFKAIVQELGDEAFKQVGTSHSYSTNAQVLLWDAEERARKGDQTAMTHINEVYTDVANMLALKSQRSSVIGQGLGVEMEVGIGNLVMASPRVQAAEVLGTREATDLVQKQVQEFFSDPGVKSQFEKLYIDAMKGSKEVTNAWKTDINAGNFTTKVGGIYADAAGPYTSQKTLEGIGIPFWFLIGRDPTGFEKFKQQQTHSAKKFAAENTDKEDEAARGVMMESGRYAGVRMSKAAMKEHDYQVRNPQHYWIGGHTISKSKDGGVGAWRAKYLQQADWRTEAATAAAGEGAAERTPVYGGMSVTNTRSDLKSVLEGRSRVGSVRQSRDDSGDFYQMIL